MNHHLLPPCRLFPIFARQAPKAVIFRRGPSDWTQLVLWHTDTDKFTFGQWFRGRIYVRRSDLSPNGTKLIYFANKINRKTLADKEYTYAWTAISKPPYFTALALWPKGDCWHGGGSFEDETTVLLNHKPEVAIPHPNHKPRGLRVFPNPHAYGEDDPIYSLRLNRDGWNVKQELKWRYLGYPDFYSTEQPEIRVKTHLSGKYQISMTRQIDCLDYQEMFSVTNSDSHSVVDTAQVVWADWDHNGRLILLKEGKLFVSKEDIVGHSFRLSELIDFNLQTPAFKSSPPWARTW